MKAESVVTIRKELNHRSHEELMQLCLRLVRFKKENKELLTYLLFESHDETQFVEGIKVELDQLFENINTDSYFYMKKSVRKILRLIKKFARYSLKKETEVELLLYFCGQLKALKPSIFRNKTLTNIYERQIFSIQKLISSLHEDLQYDYNQQLELINS
ncbi:hypothetical protein [Hanstruepera ponticola]|uniref:hypothetical protein n=1 Tax=Hanstruepera ponticola TaxID=2042995 RepID=UPI0017848ADA|nr:hypothetical protein [Hanstruepera ponticola]